jgi:hypothetical protein
MLRLTRSRFLVKIDSCRATSAFYSGCSPRTKATIQQHCRLWPNFIEPAVEGLFLQEIEPQIRYSGLPEMATIFMVDIGK